MPLFKKHGLCRVCKEKQGTEWGGYCKWCFNEKAVVRGQCLKARKLGLLCDLTQEQWRYIVRRFNGQCAYCMQRPYEFLEHYIPLCLGGGTTISNCVPACRNCNDRKRNKHPDNVTRIPKADLERVHEYLMSLK